MSEESPVDDYIKKTEAIIKHLKDKKAGDRLDLVSLVEEAITAINASTLGWSAWVQHPSIMKLFNETELNEIAEGLRRMSIEFLEFDTKWTRTLKERKDAEMAEKRKKKETEKQPKDKDGKLYIS
jgi:hypothetical protein